MSEVPGPVVRADRDATLRAHHLLCGKATRYRVAKAARSVLVKRWGNEALADRCKATRSR